MFGAETVAKGLTLTKVLSGLNKTLSIANQVIPIYQQAKPMIQNARSAFRVLKEFSGSSSSNSSVKPKTKTAVKRQLPSSIKKESVTTPSSNQPVFFV